MDELMEMFDLFIGDALQLEKAMEDEFKEFEKKLNDCVSQANERGTPVQNKKRPKRQASISETAEVSDTSSREEEDKAQKQPIEKSVTSAAGRPSARMLDVYGGNNVAETQQPSVTSAPEIESFARPSRTARLKAQEKLKEPLLSTKLRNDANTTVMVKKERMSTVELENDANIANRNTSNVAQPRKDEGFGSTNELSEKDGPVAEKAVVNREASLMVVPVPIPKVEVMSDEEMPPPKMPPPKMAPPKVRTKKKVASKNQDKLADETASSSAVSSAESSIASSSSSIAANRRTRGRPRKENKAIEPMEEDTEIEPIRIKTEKMSIVETNEPQPEPKTATRCSDKSVYEDAQDQPDQQMRPIPQASDPPVLRSLNIVLEKVNMPPNNNDNSPASVMNGTYSIAQQHVANETYDVPPSIQDNTFTVNSPPNSAPCNETFNIPTPELYQVQSKQEDSQHMVGKTDKLAASNLHHIANASIMTEDDSVIENSPNQPPVVVPVAKARVTATVATAADAKTKKSAVSVATLKKVAPSTNTSSAASSRQPPVAKNNKELFNPCIMSPIKSRIQAFEKCATTATLTKSNSIVGTPQSRVGRVLKTISTPAHAITPQFSSLETLGAVHSAQAKDTVFTPNCATQPLVKASSASKIHQMQSKALQSKLGGVNAAGGSTNSLASESGWDHRAHGGGSGTLSSASSTSSLLDEKKKKREEKQRLAALQREAIEREKREHAERLLREKEEKYKKLVHEKQEKLRMEANKKAKKLEEFEKRRQMEDQRALADQKRDDLAKQLEQQRIDRELLETLKQSHMKDNQETKLHKQLYKQKLRQQHEQQQLAAKKKAVAAAQSEAFKFEMIDTDDTTDDEESDESAARKKKRPPPPAWCKNTTEFRKVLTIQAQVDTKVVDRLFSVQPMTPDLRILFPSIDAQKLKRNSSAIWRTPPRYSQLP